MENIIKSCGTMSEIIAALKTLQAIAGKGLPLSDMATLSNYININKIVRNQFETEI